MSELTKDQEQELRDKLKMSYDDPDYSAVFDFDISSEQIDGILKEINKTQTGE